MHGNNGREKMSRGARFKEAVGAIAETYGNAGRKVAKATKIRHNDRAAARALKFSTRGA